MRFLHKLFDVAIAKRFRIDNPCNSLKRLPQQHTEMSYIHRKNLRHLIVTLQKKNIAINCFIEY